MKSIPLPPTSHQPQPYVGPSLDQVLAQRKQFLNPGLFLCYQQPIMIVEGKMQYVWDSTGKRYLDGLGGIVTVSVGHCHPHVLAAANAQNAALQHSTTIYLNPNIGAFAENSPRKCPAISRSFISPTPAPRPTTSHCSWRASTPATTTPSRSATATTAAAPPRWASPPTAIGNSIHPIPSAFTTRSPRIRTADTSATATPRPV